MGNKRTVGMGRDEKKAGETQRRGRVVEYGENEQGGLGGQEESERGMSMNT